MTTRSKRDKIVEYLTLAFQDEMISEATAKDMALEFVFEMTDEEVEIEYKRIA